MVKTTIAQSIALKAKASILKGLAARNPWSKYSVLYRNSFVQLVNLVFRGYRGIAARRGSDGTWGRSQATMAASASLEIQFDFGDATKLARHSWVAFLTSARSTDLGELYRSLSKGHAPNFLELAWSQKPARPSRCTPPCFLRSVESRRRPPRRESNAPASPWLPCFRDRFRRLRDHCFGMQRNARTDHYSPEDQARRKSSNILLFRRNQRPKRLTRTATANQPPYQERQATATITQIPTVTKMSPPSINRLYI
jgi:hypothetical protein